VADRITIDSADLRMHQASSEADGRDVVTAADNLRASMAAIAPGGAGGLDAETINQQYFEAAQGLLDATRSVGELLVTLGGDIGKFADASDQLEAIRARAIGDDQDPYPVNGDPKLWTRAGSVLGGGKPSGPVIVS
jgi:hypothetical protein